jgi:predicted phage terminase large subunit-like protein
MPSANVKLTADLIYGFAAGLLSSGFDEPAPTPDCHREWWDMCCSLHKRVAIAAPRGHAKSTAITKCYTLAAVLFRAADYVLIVSDTYNQACLFLGEIKRELQSNHDLIELFGLKKDTNGMSVIDVDRENDVIVSFEDGHQFRISAVGSEQKVRGLLWNGRRPNLIVGDDLENDEIVMNPERRDKFKQWVQNALLPCLSERGQIRIVGTILHMGSFLESTMPRDASENSVHYDMCVKMKRQMDGWFSARYAAHGPDGSFSKILWNRVYPSGKTQQERLTEIHEFYNRQGNPEGYYQEYLNRPIDPKHAFFKEDDFGEMDQKDLDLPFAHYPCYLSVDLALSTKERRDWCVFTVGSTDQAGILHVRHIIRERLDSRDIVDTIVRLKAVYKFAVMLIGKGSFEKAIGPFLMEELNKRGLFLHIEKIPEVIDKRSRAQSIRARMRAGGVRFDKRKSWYAEFKQEMLQFDRGQHDDQVDTMSLFGLYLEQIQVAPTSKEIESQQYYEENEKFLEEEMNQGRSMIAGY